MAAAISAAAGLGARAQNQPGVGDAVRDSTAGRDITGIWQGVFRLDSTWQLPSRASSRSVPARIQFAAVGDATPTTTSPRSVHPGTFEIDFSRFGFMLSTHEALGWSVNDDAMRALLNPTVDHGLIEVHGTFRGDAIVGTWRYVLEPGGASGTFSLTKVPR
jgi:hypothetical protein